MRVSQHVDAADRAGQEASPWFLHELRPEGMSNPSSPPHPTIEHWLLLGILTLLWGSAYAFIKHAVIYLPPAALILIRISGAATLLLAWALLRGRRMPGLRDVRWLWFIALGLFGNTLPFYLISWGQQTLDSALTGILVAVMPLITIALAHVFVPGERMSLHKLLGFLIGFVGVIILLGPTALENVGGPDLVSQLAVLGAAACYSINAILARLLPETSPSVSGAGMLIMAALIALPFGLAEFMQIESVPVSAWGAVAWLAIAPTAIASVMLMHVARTAGPGFLAIVNYLTPIAALITGVIIGETIGWTALLALAVILSGVWLARRG